MYNKDQIAHLCSLTLDAYYMQKVRKPLLSAERVNSLPDDKILHLSKLKSAADDKLNLTQNLRFVFQKLENIVGKGENAGHQHFLLFPQCFQNLSFSGSLNVGIVW